jgi:hypothetical protein
MWGCPIWARFYLIDDNKLTKHSKDGCTRSYDDLRVTGVARTIQMYQIAADCVLTAVGQEMGFGKFTNPGGVGRAKKRGLQESPSSRRTTL